MKRSLKFLMLLLSVGAYSSSWGQSQLYKKWYSDRNQDSIAYLAGIASCPANDNGIVTCGEIDDQYMGLSTTNGGIFVMRQDSTGKTLWSKRFTFPNANYYIVRHMIRSSYGKYLITGTVPDTSTNTMHAFILEVDSNGNRVWDRLYEGNTWSNAILQCRDQSTGSYVNSYVIVGSREDSSSNDQYLWVTKVSSGGNIIWSRDFDYKDSLQYSQEEVRLTDVTHIGFDIIQTDDEEWIGSYPFYAHDGIQDDGYAITGVRTITDVDGYYEYNDAFIVKLDNGGNLEDWAVYDDLEGYYSVGLSILETDDDNNGKYDDGYIVAGYYGDDGDYNKERAIIGGTFRHGLIINVADDLSTQWSKFYYNSAQYATPNLRFYDMISIGTDYYIAGDWFGPMLAKINQSGAVQYFQSWQEATITYNSGDCYHVYNRDSQLVLTGLTSTSVGWGLGVSLYKTDGTSNGCLDETLSIGTGSPEFFDYQEEFEDVDPIQNKTNVNTTPVDMELRDRYSCGMDIALYKKMTSDPDVITGASNGANWEFRITRSDGDETIVETDASGVWEGNLSNLYSYVITERFKPDYIPVQPVPSSYQLDSGLLDTACTFYNHQVNNWCPLYDGMIAYFHFQEKDGDETLNVMGPNGIFRRMDNGDTLTGTGVIGWDPTDMVVKTTTGAAVPFRTNPRTFYLKTDNVNKTSENVYIEVPNYPELEAIGDDEFTIEYYIRVDTILNSGGQGGILQKEERNGGTPVHGWDMDVHRQGTSTTVDIYSDFHGNSDAHPAKWSGALTMGTMSHIAMVKRDVGVDSFNLELYVNGVSQGVKTVHHHPDTDFTTTAPLELLPHYWKGVIDELSIYNRALSAAEIADIDTNGKCWDYVRFNDYTADCYSASEAEGSAVIYNGHINDQDFRYAFAALPMGTALPDGTGNSTADGPGLITPNNGSVTVSKNDVDTIFYTIPCRASYHGYSSAYQITVFNDEEWIETGMKTTHYGKSLQPQPAAETGEEDENLATQILNDEESFVSPYKVYPNPASAQVFIESNAKTSLFSLYALDGRVLVQNQTMQQGKYSFDVSDLKNGIYLIQLHSVEYGTISYRFIKE